MIMEDIQKCLLYILCAYSCCLPSHSWHHTWWRLWKFAELAFILWQQLTTHVSYLYVLKKLNLNTCPLQWSSQRIIIQWGSDRFVVDLKSYAETVQNAEWDALPLLVVLNSWMMKHKNRINDPEFIYWQVVSLKLSLLYNGWCKILDIEGMQVCLDSLSFTTIMSIN